jgi:hypothetical protein
MSTSTPPRDEREGLRFSPWNLLLLLPFLMLVTPWFNAMEPKLFGMPFFYWIQFAWVAVGVVAVGLVFIRTRDDGGPDVSGDDIDVDELDEGSRR